MSLIEGTGGFKCIKCNYETRDIKKWNEHCSRKEGNTTHITESGWTYCKGCNEEVEFEEMPYTPFNELGQKPIIVLCDECAENQTAVKSVKKISKAGTKK